MYLRLKAINNVVEGSFSYNLNTWYDVGEATIALGESAQVGIFGINEWNKQEVYACVMEFSLQYL